MTRPTRFLFALLLAAAANAQIYGGGSRGGIVSTFGTASNSYTALATSVVVTHNFSSVAAVRCQDTTTGESLGSSTLAGVATDATHFTVTFSPAPTHAGNCYVSGLIGGRSDNVPTFDTGTAVPATCGPLSFYLKTDTKQLYTCNSSNKYQPSSYLADLAANRPTLCDNGQIFSATDTGVMSRCSAGAWGSPNFGNNVGIGTTSPIVSLDVAGAGRFQAATYAAPTSGIGIEIGYWTTYGFVGAWDRTGGGSVMKPLVLQPGSGNVGIGTTSPASRFHVYDATPTTGTTTVTVQAGAGQATNPLEKWLTAAGAELARVASNGALLIGTATDTTSGAKLQIAGNLQLSAGTTTAQPTCDAAHAGVIHYSGHTAGAKDAVAVCAADAANAYAWRTIY